MLWRSRYQFGLLHSDRAGMRSDLPTFRLQLGSIYAWNVRRPEVLGSIHWSLQLVDGHHNRCVTVARFMGASNADGKKVGSERIVLYGNDVRTALFSWAARNAN